jgi:acetyltransferase-like isoleucine patch superfamily enzyme
MPLQARLQMAHDPTVAYPRCTGCNQVHIPHCEPTRNTSQPHSDPQSLNEPDGARIRRNVVGDQERESPAPSNCNNGRNEAPHNSHLARVVPIPTPFSHDRAPSHSLRNSQPQGPLELRQHNPGVYHHAPQSIGQTAYYTPTMADSCHAAPSVARQSSPMVPPKSAPPAPQPSHRATQLGVQKIEKEKMLDGEPFLPSDELLMNERDHCSGALFSFNSITNPHVTISQRERDRNFRRILLAHWVPSPRHMDRRLAVHTGGHVGENVNVATPFHCDYGYNLFVADNVTIGAYCQLHDSARIAIGGNTTIGNGVKIQTLKTPTDTKSLKGSNGTEIAVEVHIGGNVYIGDNVIIEAGVNIGHNAIIRSGSVVSNVRTAQ